MKYSNLFLTTSRMTLIVVLIAAILFFILIPPHVCVDYDPHAICSAPARCANIEMTYPFWSRTRPEFCGHPAFKLNCIGDVAEITIMSQNYQVLQIDQMSHTLTVARTDYLNDACPTYHVNTTLDTTFFDYTSYTRKLFFYYGCHLPENWSATYLYSFRCYENETEFTNYCSYGSDSDLLQMCKEVVVVPVSRSADWEQRYFYVYSELSSLLKSGFGLEWKANNSICYDCRGSGGQCGYESSSGGFTCHCRDRSYPITCGSDANFAYDERYLSCNRSFDCSNLKNIGFPFWGWNRPQYCGHPEFKLNCSGDTAEITIMSTKYRVLEINHTTHTMRVDGSVFSYCSPQAGHRNSILDSIFFDYTLYNEDLTIYYNCSSSSALPGINMWNFCPTSTIHRETFCLTEKQRKRNQTLTDGTPLSAVVARCDQSAVFRISESVARYLDNFAIPEYPDSFRSSIFYDFGFWLGWNLAAINGLCEDCQRSGGLCGYNSSSGEFTCYCRNQPYPKTCESFSESLSKRRDWAIGISAILSGVIIISILIILGHKRKYISRVFASKNNKSDVELFMRKYGPFAPERYTYAAVKKMTNSFTKKIGQGGYGTIYKGKLSDGSLVAVKVLIESKGNGEEFINEVASIGRTSHVNIVGLLGFCFERNQRILIYEYMSNGSLDKFIFSKDSLDTNTRLGWKTLYEISVGIARGLEYLHRGCTTQILHFDIKPHNILLDCDFCPKISDFGLSKLCQRDDSVVSMKGARGTIGYIAPEVYCRNFGRVSNKSDVYSYGMMVLEIVGGRKNIDVGVSRTSEIYFPDWICKQVESGENLEIGEEMTKEDEEIVRKMILVSLWCIQPIPSDRPSMSKVVEMLQKSVESLEIPPKPSIFPMNK